MTTQGSSGQLAKKKLVAVIGTGDFGTSVGFRLLSAGYEVVYGSRFPDNYRLEQVDSVFHGVRVVPVPECIASAEVVILALHYEHHQVIRQYEQLLRGKILVDVSNVLKKPPLGSCAERLAKWLPNTHVVKAFNTVSAHALREDSAGSTRIVPVCGDDPAARGRVMQMASSMGLQAVEGGGLAMARRQEASTRTLFEGWVGATVISLILFVLWTVYSILRYYVIRKDNPYTWERFPLNVINKVMSCVSLTLLAFCYLPGCIAALIQMYHGTKHIRFHDALDSWMKMRKALGVLALVYGLLHAFMSLALMTPAYYSKWFLSSSVTVPGNSTQDVSVALAARFNWMGETTILFASISTALMTILGFTSLSTVANRLNWREWDILHSYVGFLTLLTACAHVTIKAAPDWVDMTAGEILQGLSFLSQFIPYVTLFLKLVIFLPCVSSYVWKIRHGWVRDMENQPTQPYKPPPQRTVTGYNSGSPQKSGEVHLECEVCCTEYGRCSKNGQAVVDIEDVAGTTSNGGVVNQGFEGDNQVNSTRI